jgi:hypothetical protein
LPCHPSNIALLDNIQVEKSTATVAAQAVLQPHASNNRVPCENLMKVAQSSQPVFAVQQEYTILSSTAISETVVPNLQTPPNYSTGWPHSHLPDPSKPFFVPEETAAPEAWPHSHLPDPSNPFYVPPFSGAYLCGECIVACCALHWLQIFFFFYI